MAVALLGCNPTWRRSPIDYGGKGCAGRPASGLRDTPGRARRRHRGLRRPISDLGSPCAGAAWRAERLGSYRPRRSASGSRRCCTTSGAIACSSPRAVCRGLRSSRAGRLNCGQRRRAQAAFAAPVIRDHTGRTDRMPTDPSRQTAGMRRGPRARQQDGPRVASSRVRPGWRLPDQPRHAPGRLSRS
jgi:hypothetical protein